MGIDSSVFVWACTKSVCAKLGWSHCYESLTNLNKKCCGRLNRDWIRSLQPSPCVFKILFILLQIHKVNKTSVEDKCLQCSRFFLILPSTPCSNLKASKTICLKCTLNKCFLIKNSLHISVQLAELCWCSRDQNLSCFEHLLTNILKCKSHISFWLRKARNFEKGYLHICRWKDKVRWGILSALYKTNRYKAITSDTIAVLFCYSTSKYW